MNKQPFQTAWRGTYLALAILLTDAASPRAADLGTTQGSQWFPYLEWTLNNPTWTGNPFDVVAVVEFRHSPSGETRRTEMFYAGDTTWAFRFTGTRQGLWSFVSSSDDPDLQGHTGQVRIAPNTQPQAHGFLKKFGSKWGWQGAEIAFVPQLVMWDYLVESSSPKAFYEKPDVVDQKIALFLETHGFGGFHLSVIGGRWFDLEAVTDRVVPTMSEPDNRTFEALELLITRTHRAGGMVHLWSWGDHSRSQTPRSLTGGIGGAIDKRLQRFIAARLGPVPGWSIGYGFDLDEWVSADQIRTWRNSIHQHSGWFHFFGGRPAGPNRGPDHTTDAAWNQGLDYSSYEHHQPTYPIYAAALTALPDQPVLSEDRFRIRKSPYPEKDYTGELTRRGLYDSTLAGGVANIWGIDPNLSPGGVYPNSEQIHTYSVFFHQKGRFLTDMKPANQLSNDGDTRVLLSPSARSLVLFRENTDTIQVDLTDFADRLPAVAVDTTKAYREIELQGLPPEDQRFRLPYVSDWVIAVGRFR